MNDREKFIFSLLFLLSLITIPFSSNTNAIFVLSFTGFNIWICFKTDTVSPEFRKFCIANMLFTISFLIGLINTKDLHNALKTIEARYPIIIFPMLLLLTGKLWNTNLIIRLLICFALTTTGCGLIIQISLLKDLIANNEPLSFFFYWRYSGADLSQRINIHPTYLSMCVLLSIGILYEFLILKRTTRTKSIVGVVLITYLVILIFHLASRISLVALILVAVVLLIQALVRYGRKSVLVLIPITLACFLLFNLEIFAIKSRLENPIGFGGLFLSGSIPTTGGDRHIVAWYASLEIIRENFLFGVGSGDVKSSLNAVYKSIDAPDLVELNLNSHNQYLGAFLENGMGGIITLLILFLYGLFDLGLKKNLYLIFIVIIVTISLAENILDRQIGAVFFGAFNSLLYALYKTD